MKMRNTTCLFVFALALTSACAPAPTATPLPTTTQTPTATATSTFTPTPTLTETASPTSTPTPLPSPTRAPTPTPEPSPTPVGNYVEVPGMGPVTTYGGVIDFATLPPTEQREQAAINNSSLGIVKASGWMGFAIYQLPGGADDYAHLTRGERRTGGLGHPAERPFSQLMMFKAKKNGSDLMNATVLLKDGSTKVAIDVKIMI